MTSKRDDIPRNDLVRKHRAGETAGELMREYGVSHKVIVRILGADYMSLERMNDRLAPKVITAYQAGQSENAVAQKFKIGRRVIWRMLRDAGIERRGQSEAERMKWAKMPKAKRRQQVTAAHNATRGRKRSFAELCKSAQGRERNPSPFASHYERRLIEMLAERGVTGTVQLAIGPYNSDIAIKSVAVEVWGGYWHLHGRHLARLEKRFRYIMDSGWHVLAIVLNETRFPLTPAVADYVAAHVKRMSRKPSAIREYRVIWGAGQFATGGCANDDHIAIVPPFTYRRNSVTGQYETAPR